MEKKITFSEIWKEARVLCKKNYWKVVPFMFLIVLMSMTSVIPASVFGGSAVVKNAFSMILSLVFGPILSLSIVYAMIKESSIKESLNHILKNWRGAIKTTYLVAGIVYSFVAILMIALLIGVGFMAISAKIPILGSLGIILAILAGIAAFFFMIVVSFRYAFAIYLWVDRKMEGFKALAASRELTKGSIGKIALYVFLLYLIFIPAVLIGIIIAAIAGAIAGSEVVMAVLIGLVFMAFMLFAAPFAVAFMVSLYKGIVSLKEQSDFEGTKIKGIEKFAAVFGVIIFILLMIGSIFIPEDKQKEDKFGKAGEVNSLLQEEKSDKADGIFDQDKIDSQNNSDTLSQPVQNQQIINP